MTKLIDERTEALGPEMVADPVQEQLLQIIAAKKKGKRPAKPKSARSAASNVVNIMDALKRSIGCGGESAKSANRQGCATPRACGPTSPCGKRHGCAAEVRPGIGCQVARRDGRIGHGEVGRPDRRVRARPSRAASIPALRAARGSSRRRLPWRRGRCGGSRPGSCPCRFALVTVATNRSGLSAAMACAMALAKAFTAGQSAFGFSGATTCRPLPPEVLTKLASPARRTAPAPRRAAAMTVRPGHASPGSRSMTIRSGCSEVGQRRSPGWISSTPACTRPIRPSRSSMTSSGSASLSAGIGR